MIRTHYTRFLSLLLILVFTLNFQASSGQNLLTEVEINEISFTDFPQVSVVLQTRDESGKPVLGLGSADFEVTEEGQLVNITSVSVKEAGIYAHFLIDAGAGLSNSSADPRWDNARNSIINFVQTTPWVQEGLDTVAVSSVTASGTRQLITATSEDMSGIVQSLESFSPPGGSGLSGTVEAAQDLIEDIKADPLAEGKAKFIVLLTSNFETGSNAQIAKLVESSLESNIPIYTVLLRKTPDQYSAKVAEVARDTNGVYTEFDGNRSLIPAYEAMTTYRNQYQIDYDSKSGVSGIRRVVVNALVGNGSVQAQEDYSIDLAPPRVVITSPENGKLITRTATEFTTQLNGIEPTTQDIVAEVIFPDGYPRRLSSAELFIGTDVVGTATGTRELEFDWDLRRDQYLGTTPNKLTVKVVDVLGLEAVSEEVKVDVKLEIPEAIAEEIDIDAITVGIEDSLREEIKKEFEAVLIPCASEDLFGGALCSTERFFRGNLVSMSAILVSLGAVFYVSKSSSQVAVNVRQTAKDVYARVTSRYQRAEARAYLVVMEGDPNLIGQSIEIYGDTPIGRSREVAEVIFQQNDSTSPISRLHCTILDHEDHFKIQDEDSANGTFLNGARMRPLVEEDLRDGDTLEFGQIARGGVKIIFQIADDHDGEDDMRETQRTLSSANSFSDNHDEF
jgi:hypothetical protein